MPAVTLQNLRPTTAEQTKQRVPVREFLLFPWGQIDTAYGTYTFDRKGSAELMRRYKACTQNRDGWLDIDIAHLSHTEQANIEAHESAGRFRVQLRTDGLWAVDLTYRPDIYERLVDERLKYYSPVIYHDEQNRIIELAQLSLTNIPAMHAAQPLALARRKKGESMSKQFNRVVLLSLALSARAETPVMLEDKPGMLELLNGLMEQCVAALPGCHLEDVYEEYAIVGIEPTEMGLAREQYMKVPYTVMNGKVSIGTPIQVVKKWEPLEGAEAQEAEKMERMSQHLQEAKSMLLAATGKQSTAAAIGEIERLRIAEQTSKTLSARLEKLEARNFDSEKAVILSAAKSSGKWTVGLEKLALANADRARRLGEDPLAAVRETFDMAPVVVAPGREMMIQPEAQAALSAEERKAVNETSKMLGLDPKTYETQFLANKSRIRV